MMRGWTASTIVAAMTWLLPCASEARPPEECDTSSYFGVAEMLSDGTIAVMFRIVTDIGIGEGYREIAPSDPIYGEYLAHIGGLKPGEEKVEPPWLPAHCQPRENIGQQE
jgi:hypothetical protein